MLRRLRRTVILFAVAAALGVAPAVSASASAGAAAIGPNQYFVGLVNGTGSNAVIKVVCPGPENLSGSPISGQTIGVNQIFPPTSSDVGFTGSDATSIVASLNWLTTSSGPPPPVLIGTFTAYGSLPIPTGIKVPCSGPGTVTFTPSPDVAGRPATVDVTFANIAN